MTDQARAMELRSGVENPGLVDLVRVPAEGPVELVVVQPGGWDGTDRQLLLLQEKLNRYLEHVVDGELGASHPEAAGRPWTVVVETSVPPDDRTAAYLRLADRELRRAGGGTLVRLSEPPAE
jgi:hypothetical protein